MVIDGKKIERQRNYLSYQRQQTRRFLSDVFVAGVSWGGCQSDIRRRVTGSVSQRGAWRPANADSRFVAPAIAIGRPAIKACVPDPGDAVGAHHMTATPRQKLPRRARHVKEIGRRRAGAQRRDRDSGAAQLVRERLAELST